MPSMNPNIQYGFAPPMMPMMAGGGVASLANQVQDKGRGPDTMLVHMAPSEVAGLQALAMAHGGSLSINPETGLPEAGFLKNLLPTLIGAGLTFFSGGAINPMTAGMLVGGFEGIRKKDLGQGILAGLGAFGGAGLGSALTSAGGQAAMMSEVGKQAAGTSAAQMGTEQGAQAIMQAGARPETFMGNLQMAGQGIANLGQPGGFSALGTGLNQAFPTMTQKVLAANPLLVSAAEASQPKYTPPSEEKSTYAGPYVPSERAIRYPTDEERRSSREFNYFAPSNPVPGFRTYFAAQGGLMGLDRGGSFDDEPGSDGYAKGGVDLADGSFIFDARTVSEAGNGSTRAGERVLAKAFNAKPIRGPGDGVSDSIKANIGGKQEARVADGEMKVLPKDVKKAGGASKLYAFMNKAHKARKIADRGVDTGLRRLLPA